MSVKCDMAFEAVRVVAERVRRHGFGDLLTAPLDDTEGAGIDVDMMDAVEIAEYCPEGSRDWVGMYRAGSVESETGLKVYLAVDAHADVRDMADTIAHEVGHALWELLAPESQEQWCGFTFDGKYKPEEYFADNFMYLLRGDAQLMRHSEFWAEITKVG